MSFITPEIVVAGLALFGTMFGSVTGVLTANRLTSYRISLLEKEVEKHNDLVERMTAVEQSTKSAHKGIDELNEEVEQ